MPQKNKRKRNINQDDEAEEDDKFVASDDDYSEYDMDALQQEFRKKRKILDPDTQKEYDKLKKVQRDKEVTLEKVLKSKLNQDDKIWFIDQLSLLELQEPDSEEYFRIRDNINKKYYESIQNINHQDTIIKLKKISNLEHNILEKILTSKHSDIVKSIMYKKYEKYIGQKDLSEEYYKDLDWIETVLDVPTSNKLLEDGNISKQIQELKACLDTELYGIEHVKESIIDAFCAMKSNPQYQKKIITLVGPPGVGKTAVAGAIAKALNLPFDHVSMDSVRDPNVLIGHSSTYIGSGTGVFVRILRKAKVLNPVILIDEVDKISDDGKFIHAILINILDKTRNKEFKDMYMPEIPIDMSNVFFILALNNIDAIDKVLRDRLYVINIDGYTEEEKVYIGTKYLCPKIKKNLGLTDKDLIINDKVVLHIIRQYTNQEHGVRSLEHCLNTICEKLNVLKQLQGSKTKINLSYSNIKYKVPFNITTEDVDILLS
jgi:ATP-dependent Lon protease